MKTKPERTRTADLDRAGARSFLPLALAVGGLIYALFFFGVADTSRLVALTRLLIPDTVFSLWCGGSVADAVVFDRAGVLLAAAVITFVAWATGDLLLRWFALGDQLDRLERYVLAQTVGFATVSTFTLLVGCCGGLHQRWIFALAAMVVVSLQLATRFSGRTNDLSFRPSPLNPTDRKLLIVGAVAAVPFLLVYLFGGLLVPWDFDVREYHLQAPKEWLLAGRISFLPHNVYANMPLGAEMFAILGGEWFTGDRAWWYGAIMGKLVMALFAPLGALGLFVMGRRFWSPAAGVAAGLVYLSLPGLLGNAIAGLNETPLATYTVLAVFATLCWGEAIRDEGGAPKARIYLLAAGYLAGAAAGCKYPALVSVCLPLALIVLGWPRAEKMSAIRWLQSLRWREGLVFFLAALAGGGLWYAKNAVLTGNPVYPLAYSVFGGETRTPEKDAQWKRAVRVPGQTFDDRYGPTAIAASAGNILLSSEQLSLVLWPAAAAALVFAGRDWRVRVVALLATLMFLTWLLFSHRLERFWIPYLPLVALLAGVTLGALWKERLGRVVAGGLLALSLLHSLAAGTLGVYAKDEDEWQLTVYPYFVALDKQRTSPDTVNPFHLYLNEHVPAESAVLLVGDAEPFDLEVRALYNTCFDDSVFEQLLRARSPAEQRAALRERHISHVYVHWGHVERYRSAGNYGFTDWVTPKVFKELVAQGLLRKVTGVEASEWYGELYEVQ